MTKENGSESTLKEDIDGSASDTSGEEENVDKDGSDEKPEDSDSEGEDS